MRIGQYIHLPSAHQTLAVVLGVLFFLVTFAWRSCAQTAPYFGAMGGIAVLSADAGSRTTSGGLNLSSYAPANGGALDLFAGVNTRNYFTLQMDYIGNGNDLRLNSTSSDSATFYQEDRKSSQQAVMFNAMIYFRRTDSRIRPYLGAGVGVVHLSSRVGRLGDVLAFARKCSRIVRASFGISALYNALGVAIAAAGLLSPLVCAFLMPISSITVVLFACGTTKLVANAGGLSK